MWIDYALASGSPIGVAGVEKTVVTAATFRKGKWQDVPVKLKVPKGAGGMNDLPDYLPQMRADEAYPHMRLPRSIGGDRKYLVKKLRKGTVTLVAKLQKPTLTQPLRDRTTYYYTQAPGGGTTGR